MSSGSASIQLVDGAARDVRGFGAIEELGLGVNSVTAVIQNDLDAGRCWRVCAFGVGVYAQQGQPAELTAGTGRKSYVPSNTAVILRAVLGEGIRISY